METDWPYIIDGYAKFWKDVRNIKFSRPRDHSKVKKKLIRSTIQIMEIVYDDGAIKFYESVLNSAKVRKSKFNWNNPENRRESCEFTRFSIRRKLELTFKQPKLGYCKTPSCSQRHRKQSVWTVITESRISETISSNSQRSKEQSAKSRSAEVDLRGFIKCFNDMNFSF